MDKSGKFSWSRLINNAIPNFANDDKGDVDLSPTQADSLVEWQLSRPNPRYLDEAAFFVAGITQNESFSSKVHKALLKAGIILPAPTDSSSTAPNPAELITVNTSAIGKGFASQLAVISVHAQRKLVGLLFFWEEECTRWKLLDAEEREILSALNADPGNADLKVALEAVQMKKNLLPSRRGEGTANVSAGAGHELPSYVGGQT